MKFRVFQKLLNSEGDLLTLKESENPDPCKERMYIEGLLIEGGKIYSKINDTALKLFFNNQLRIKDLFLLRNDEPYIIIDIKKNNTSKIYTDKDLDVLMSKIHCGDNYYYSFGEEERCISPQDALRYVNMYFINGLGSIKRN